MDAILSSLLLLRPSPLANCEEKLSTRSQHERARRAREHGQESFVAGELLLQITSSYKMQNVF